MEGQKSARSEFLWHVKHPRAQSRIGRVEQEAPTLWGVTSCLRGLSFSLVLRAITDAQAESRGAWFGRRSHPNTRCDLFIARCPSGRPATSCALSLYRVLASAQKRLEFTALGRVQPDSVDSFVVPPNGDTGSIEPDVRTERAGKNFTPKPGCAWLSSTLPRACTVAPRPRPTCKYFGVSASVHNMVLTALSHDREALLAASKAH